MKKKLGLLLTIGLSALLLVACGNKSNQADTKTPGTLTIGMEGTYAPYAYRAKNGKLTGIILQFDRTTQCRFTCQTDGAKTKICHDWLGFINCRFRVKSI